MQLKRGLNVAITRNTLTQHLATRAESVTTRTNIVVTQTDVFTLESQLLANNPHAWKVNGRLTETVRDRPHMTDITRPHPHRPSAVLIDESRTLRPQKRLEHLWGLSRMGRAAQSVSSASTRLINRRSAASSRLDASSPSKSLMSFVASVTMSRAS